MQVCNESIRLFFLDMCVCVQKMSVERTPFKFPFLYTAHKHLITITDIIFRRGSSALTDCHYLSKALGGKGLSAYYLGCAMSDVIRDTVQALLQEVPEVDEVKEVHDVEAGQEIMEQILSADGVGESNEAITVVGDAYRGVVKVRSPYILLRWYHSNSLYFLCLWFKPKQPTTSATLLTQENLILVDADFFQDYPPFPRSLTLSPPSGFTFLLAKGFSKEVMPLLLQRAKIVLDLGECMSLSYFLSNSHASYFLSFLDDCPNCRCCTAPPTCITVNSGLVLNPPLHFHHHHNCTIHRHARARAPIHRGHPDGLCTDYIQPVGRLQRCGLSRCASC